MQYLLLICTDADGEPADAATDDPEAWWAALHAAGRHLAGDRLEPASAARTVRVRAGERAVHDGPGSGALDEVVGFDVVEADDLDAAIAVAAAHPMARMGRVEVRPTWPL